ncbi:MAG TPA: hypothetical protein VK666_22390 [Chryseolinea sp.]|nr:hypothetical protein [Chryseolinea sp.]
MNNSKRILVALIFVSFFAWLIGCNKSKDNPLNLTVAENSMSYELNGGETKFTTCTADIHSTDSFMTVSISALSNDDTTRAISITLGSSYAINGGFTFNESAASSNAEGFISYLENTKGYHSLTLNENAAAKVEVQITERTSTNVKGTFTGKLYAQDDQQAAPYVITGGQFNAKIVQQ